MDEPRVEISDSLSFNQRISKLFDEIDEVRVMIIVNKKYVLVLEERLKLVWIRLKAKANPEETNKLSDILFEIKPLKALWNRHINNPYLAEDYLQQILNKLNQFEAELFGVMERIGLTNPPKESRRRFG